MKLVTVFLPIISLSDQVQEASGQNRAGVCRPLCHLLAAQPRDLPVPLLPLRPGGHLAGPLRRQRVRPRPGLHQLLREPVCSLPDEQKLPQALQKAAAVLPLTRTLQHPEQPRHQHHQRPIKAVPPLPERNSC